MPRDMVHLEVKTMDKEYITELFTKKCYSTSCRRLGQIHRGRVVVGIFN